MRNTIKLCHHNTFFSKFIFTHNELWKRGNQNAIEQQQQIIRNVKYNNSIQSVDNDNIFKMNVYIKQSKYD